MEKKMFCKRWLTCMKWLIKENGKLSQCMQKTDRRFKVLLRVLWKVKDLFEGSPKSFDKSFINVLLKV